MKIAVCDDDESDLQLMLSYCRQYAPNTQTVAFRDGETLLAAFKSDFFDLVFLDIEMGHPDGLEVGSLLVNASHKPVIVFTTHSLNYAVRGYGIALRYLHKPISYDTFSDVMKLALEQILPQKIKLYSNGVQMVLSVQNILYFEALRHQLIAYLTDGKTITVRDTLTDTIDRVPHRAFVQPHKSYYINMDYIDCLTQQAITMTNGDVIPVGRSKKTEFLLRFNEYMRENSSNEYLD